MQENTGTANCLRSVNKLTAHAPGKILCFSLAELNIVVSVLECSQATDKIYEHTYNSYNMLPIDLIAQKL